MKVLTTLMIAIPKQWLSYTQFFKYRDTEHWVTNLRNALGDNAKVSNSDSVALKII